MRRRSIPPLLVLVLVLVAIEVVVAFERGIVVAAIVGVPAAIVAAVFALPALRLPEAPDPGRRRVLALLGSLGVVAAAGGTALGNVVRRLTRPDPGPALEAMARNLGGDTLELVRRTYRAGRSGDLQLVLTPGSTSNYAPESLSLAPHDPRSSHALPWMYLERVPIVVYAPGMVGRLDNVDRVTLADLAPTAARLMGFDDFHAADGNALLGIPRPASPPKVVVTFVIDGGGWNFLDLWPASWPQLKRLMARGATYRNAIMGSFPAVTACAHATIGTGAFPRTHGITGHNIRDGSKVRKAYGTAGHADPSDILVPTLADRWSAATEDGAWVGEIGYQVWHLGMLGRGGRPLGELPVGVYFDEDESHRWQPHNPNLYRLPKAIPPTSSLGAYAAAYATDPANQIDARFNPAGSRADCCSPPIARYEGDLIEATLDAEGIGAHAAPDLLYINFKSPDYAGHTWNMTSRRTAIALESVDEQLGRLVTSLEDRFAPGEFALIVCADHGQCPTVDLTGGVRLDPIKLQQDLQLEFGDSILGVVTSVVPSEIYLDERGLWDAGVSRDDICAFLRDYRYRDNLGPYVKPPAVDWDRLDERPFAAVLPTDFIGSLEGKDLTSFGAGRFFAASDPGIPEIRW